MVTHASAIPVVEQSSASDRLNSRQWRAIGIFALGAMFEFFDNYVIAFVLAFIVRPWALTAGESAIVLLSSGMGGLIGAMLWGYVSDRIGRKLAFVLSLLVTASASLLLALTPEGNWVYLAAMRAIVGVGVGGFFVPIILVQEIVPSSRRGFASGLLSTAAASGLVIGALSAATVAEIIGWRGLFLLGTLPAFLAIIALRSLPESPGWLASKGRTEEATQALRWTSGDPTAQLPTAAAAGQHVHERAGPKALAAGMLGNFGTVTAYTALVMWSPTLIVQVQSVTATQAARLMIVISIVGMISRMCAGVVSDHIGRRNTGLAACLLAAASVMLASLVARSGSGADSFWLALGASFLFADAAFATLAAYTAEIFPAAARGRASGISYAAGSVGKVVGPLGFGLAMGASNVLKPEMTVAGIVPGFGFVAILFLIAAGAYAFIRPALTFSSGR